MTDERLPSFRELPVVPGAPPRSAWGLWGEDDELGTLNLLTPERRLAALSCVRSGRVFNLNLPIDEPWRPPGSRRGNPEHHIQWVGMAEPALDGHDDLTALGDLLVAGRDDLLTPLWLQGSSQWDGLGHVRHPEYGNYNGVPDEDIHGREGARLGIDRWADDAVVGRGVLLDVAHHLAELGNPIDPSSNRGITADDLRGTIERQQVEVRTGDVLLLHTGWMHHYRHADEAYRRQAYTPGGLRTPGLAATDEVLELLWDLHPAAIGADNTSVEQVPADDPAAEWRFHSIALPLWGLAVGESWHLHDLAEDCRADGQYDFLFVAVPLNVRGGLGSPANAIALK